MTGVMDGVVLPRRGLVSLDIGSTFELVLRRKCMSVLFRVHTDGHGWSEPRPRSSRTLQGRNKSKVSERNTR